MRALLLRLASDEHVLLIDVHHIVSDGWSTGILLRELGLLYRAAVAREPSPLPELPLQYASFASWQRQWLSGEVLERQLAYWRGRLAGAPGVLDLPTDRPRPAVQSLRGADRSCVLPAPLAAALQTLAREQGVTLFMILLAALDALLHRLTGQDDLVLGSPVANRNQVGIEDLVGFFVNTLVLRADLGGDPSFRTLLRRVRETTLEAYAHQDLPFEKLVEELAPERSLAHAPLFQVMLSLQNTPMTALALPGLVLEPLAGESGAAKFDLAFSFEEVDGSLTGHLEYSSDLFDGATMDRWLDHFEQLLATVVADPGVRIASVELLAVAARHQILGEWNDTRVDFPATTLLHQFFEASAGRAPEALAAVCAGRELTYAALEAGANRLAHLLRGAGAGRGAGVGVWVERSFDMLTAVLGVLKAGGHYVPLDDAWPAARVESILAATGASAVVVAGSLLPAVEEMRWRLPELSDVVCLDVAEPEPPVEALDGVSVAGLWDFVAERAVDRVTAGGFVSALTGEPMSDAEVDEYRDRVLSLAEPWLRPDSRVLEIGNGSGLLLWELAARVSHVTGVDPSPLTQGRNRERAAEEGIGNVELLTGFAHESGDLLEDGARFDLILLASTVQFFPGPRYFERVVRWALGRLAPGGAVLVADVLDARRREELRRAIESAGAAPSARRQELYLDEDHFQDLGAKAAIHLRGEGFPNELAFRYDVILTPGETPAPRPRKRLWTGWHAGRAAADRLPAVAAPEDVAYVIHTSGSTGTPKGIVVQHRQIANLIDCLNRSFAVGTADRGLFVTSLCFDLSVYDVFGMLGAGGTVHVATGSELADPDRLVGLLRTEKITLWNSAPAALLRLAPLFPAEPDGASRLRLVFLAGDWIPVTLPERVRRAFPAAEVVSFGGTTETTVFSNVFRIGEVDPAWASIPYGRPLANNTYHVLDAALSPCPIGVAGDLYIGGDGVSLGYVGRPELTARAFLPDPFATLGGRPGMRLYFTGDRGRYGADGTLELLGRLDEQVKIRGYRIELGEIELALGRQPGVREAVVLAREDEPGDKRLVAYVVPAAGGELSTPALADALRGALPEYMVPAAFVVLEALPVTANGKLDRRALPAPEWGAGAVFEPPRTPVEEVLAAIWSQLLGVPRVGREDGFFALGGHSLLATQMVSRVREALGIELPLRALFERPKLADLAVVVEAARATGGMASLPAPRPVARTERGDLPLSFAQERLWFLDQYDPGSATYNIPVTVELVGSLDVAALVAAFAEVVRRQGSLRTTFAEIDGVPRQQIAPFNLAGLPQVDLAALPPAVGRREAARLAEEQEGRGFDLRRGPLFRAVIVRLERDLHQFLLTFHHVISDGWSVGVLVRELGALYAAAVAGNPSPLAELAIQYADFAAWQRQWLAAESAAELAYWETRLGGEVAPVELPADRPRPAIQTFRGGRRQHALPAALTARLKSFGQAEGVTLFMTLLAATQELLSRHSGEHDVAVGAPVAGRQWVETEGLIGCFLNTLVLRTDTSGSPSFRELVARVRTVTLEAYSNQAVPFEAVLARLNLQRDLSRTPLFQVMFNMLNLPARELSLPGLALQVLTPGEVPSKFDLTFYLTEVEGGVWIELVYNADLFDEARMAELLAQLESLLAQGVERPDAPLEQLSLVTESARRLLPDPTAALDAGWIGAVHELFAAQAARAPERPAVVDGGVTWSYGDLLAGSRGVAGWLAAHGVRPGEPVAIFAHRSAPLVQAVMGTLTAGAAFMVLDPVYPAPRLVEMLGLAVPRAWIALAAAGPVPEAVLTWLEAGGCPRLELPAGGNAALASVAAFASTAFAAPAVAIGPGDTGCIGFTSGSTGGPKAVRGLHGSLSHFLPIHRAEFDLRADDRFSLLSGLAHDPLQRDIFTPLYLGATIVVPDPADIGIAGRLAEWMNAERVTVANLIPSLAQLLTQRPPDGELAVVPSLRRAILVGEALTRQDVARLRELAPGVTCINFYGATETQRAAGFHRVTEEEAADLSGRGRQVLPLGRGMPDVQLLVLNRAERLAGIGELGEIVMRSPHLAGGYLGDAALTAQRFQLNPFHPEAGDRIYRTGDLGRYLPDGEVAFAGRTDSQVKLRGFRIEPGEIEAALVRLPMVREAVVLLRDDLPGGSGLAAYVVPTAGDEGIDEAGLRGELHDALWQRLPSYMVPTAFRFLAALPRTPTGKVDRKALARQTVAVVAAAGEERGLRTPVEEIVAGLWAELLGRQRVGPDDNFFQLGGHSLSGAQVVSRLRQELQVDLPLRALFEAPTVAGLAAEIERRRAQAGGGERPTIASFHRERSAPPPLSFAQERFWVGRQLEASTVAPATIPMLARFEGALDLVCLRRALREIVDRHEVLRTSFEEGAEGAVQIVHPEIAIAFPAVDLAALPPAAKLAEIRKWSAFDRRRHFDYERAPLFRLTLFRSAETDNVLLFNIHHIAFDGWSRSVLLGELSALYDAFRAGRPSPLRPLAAQYQDFARWQRRTVAGEALEKPAAFWREHLRGAVSLDLGDGRPPASPRTFEAGVELFTVPAELERQLEAFSAEHCVTLFMTLLAAFNALLHAETGADDVVVVCLFANRNQVEVERLIGNFYAGLPLRTRLSGVRTFRALLERVRDVTLAAHENPDILYESAFEGVSFQDQEDEGGLDTFRILFQLAKLPPAEPALPGLRLTRLAVDNDKMRRDLSLFFTQADGLTGRLRYNRDILDPARVVRMRERFLALLAAIVAGPERGLAELAAETEPAVLAAGAP